MSDGGTQNRTGMGAKQRGQGRQGEERTEKPPAAENVKKRVNRCSRVGDVDVATNLEANESRSQKRKTNSRGTDVAEIGTVKGKENQRQQRGRSSAENTNHRY